MTPTRAYRNETLKFSIVIPRDWLVDDSMSDFVRFGTSEPMPYVAVQARSDEAASAGTSAMLDLELKERADFPGFTVLRRSGPLFWGPTFAPADAAVISFRLPPPYDRIEILMDIVAMVGHGQAFTLKAASFASQWDGDWPLLRTALKSFALEGEIQDMTMLTWPEYRPLLPRMFGLSSCIDLTDAECELLGCKLLAAPGDLANDRPLSLPARLRAYQLSVKQRT